jgi:hypothetical protein
MKSEENKLQNLDEDLREFLLNADYYLNIKQVSLKVVDSLFPQVFYIVFL